MAQDFNIELYLDSMPETVKRHFVQNGRCLACNVPANEHVVSEDKPNPDLVACWCATGMGRHGRWFKYVCVRAEDHPERMSRKEFEDLYQTNMAEE